jgi:hypothetical protein
LRFPDPPRPGLVGRAVEPVQELEHQVRVLVRDGAHT